MTCSGSSLFSQFTGWVCTTTAATSATNSRSIGSSGTDTRTAAAAAAPTTSATAVTAIFDLRGLEESKSNDTAPYYIKAFQCSSGGKDLMCHPSPSGDDDDDSTTMSDTNGNKSTNYSSNNNNFDDEDQMHRLASWGTFGTIGTNDSLDNIAMIQNNDNYDDDGNPIDPQIIETAIRNRVKIQQLQQDGNKNKYKPRRVVQFAYPPITSLKQCPRIDPEELDALFFSDEELATYEHDRRSTGVIDDVEIVAVSTSFSEETNSEPTAPTIPAMTTPSSSTPQTKSGKVQSTPLPPAISTAIPMVHKDTSSKTTFSFKSLRLSTPRPLRTTNQQQQPSRTLLKRRNSFGGSISTLGRGSSSNTTMTSSNKTLEDENNIVPPAVPVIVTQTTDDIPSDNNNTNATSDEQPRRLLKSVQIFLRERSTA